MDRAGPIFGGGRTQIFLFSKFEEWILRRGKMVGPTIHDVAYRRHPREVPRHGSGWTDVRRRPDPDFLFPPLEGNLLFSTMSTMFYYFPPVTC